MNKITSSMPNSSKCVSIKPRIDEGLKIIHKSGLESLFISSEQVPEDSIYCYEKKIIKFDSFFNKMKLDLVFVNMGATGIVFKAIDIETNKTVCAVKVSSYTNSHPGERQNDQRPENVDVIVSKLLSQFVTRYKTPHIILPLVCFHTKLEDVIDAGKIDTKTKSYENFLKSYKSQSFDDFAQVLLLEWCDHGDLYSYIKKNYKSMKEKEWSVIFFQLLFTLCKIYEKYPNFRHNDLKPNNLLVKSVNYDSTDTDNNIVYILDSKYKFHIPNIGIQVVLADFDFASIRGNVENNKVNSNWAVSYNISGIKDHYYDIHFFFNSFLSGTFFKPIITDKNSIPSEIKEFMERVVPERYKSIYQEQILKKNSDDESKKKKINKGILTDKGRLLVREEVTDPYKLLTKDHLFSNFRRLNLDIKN